MKTLNRRQFVQQSLGTAVALSSVRRGRAASPNNKVVVGVMGIGGRGTSLTSRFAAHKDVEIAYLCDVDTSRFAAAQKAVEAAQGSGVKCVQDFRRILDDTRVDVLINATPDHWHALGTILACQARKHVYVEKPMSYNIWEGRKMIEAARKYGRAVCVGMQTRSTPYAAAAREYVRSGALGDVLLVRVYNMMEHPMREQGPEIPPPNSLDYDLWCGPAAKLPYRRGQSWLNMAEYSCGPIPGDSIHQLDLARFVMGDPPPPKNVSHNGGILALKDGRDMPDTQFATYEYERFTLHFEGSLWSPYMKKIPQHIRDGDLFPDWPFCGTKIEILGTKAMMYLGRHGGGWQVYDRDNKLIEQMYGRQGDVPHIDNFIRCVQTGSRPNGDVEHGHQSVILCHLANIAWRCGNRKLEFDGKTESFPDVPEANRWLRRQSYRTPWVIPENV